MSNFQSQRSLNVSKSIIKSFLFISIKLRLLLPSNLPKVNKNYLIDISDSHLIHYFSPLIYAWSFKSLAGLCLIIQVISSIFLAMVQLSKKYQI